MTLGLKLFILSMAYTCDLFFFEPGTAITPASGPSAADGEVNVAVLTDDTPLFSISAATSPSDPPYASRTNTTGNFTGLIPGNYIVNARTNDNCKKELTVVIGYEVTYNPRWRVQHQSIQGGFTVRVDIEDNQYSGAVTDITGQSVPTELRWANESSESVFQPVIGSELILNVKSPTDGYFDELTGCLDERRFRATYYVDPGSGYAQKWQGFFIPMNGVEPYDLEKNFDVSFTFSDGLADLDAIPFSDDSGNAPGTRITVFDGIMFCLNKTGLQLNIWDTMQLYPLGVTVNDGISALKLIYFDPKVYLQEDGMEPCGTVLRSLLLCLGARITQSDGVWMIDNPTLKTGSTTKTRKLTYNGGSLGNAAEAYRIMLRAKSASDPKLLWRDRTQFKAHQPMYGELSFTFVYAIEEKNNILTDGFIDEDIVNGQLEGYQIDKTNGPNATAELLLEENINTLKVSFDPAFGGEYVLLSSEKVAITDPGTPFRMRFSFDIYTTPFFGTNPYIEVEYAILFEGQLSDYFLLPAISNGGNVFGNDTDQVIDGQYLRFYVTEHNSWKTVTVDIYTDPAGLSGEFPGDLQVIFRLKDNILYDYASLADLSAVDVDTASAYPLRTYANKTRALWSDVLHTGGDPINTYELEAGDDATAPPDIVRGTSGVYQWNLKSAVLEPAIHECWLTSLKIRNVVLAYLPDGADPEEKTVDTFVINANVKRTLPVIFRHGDMPDDENYKNISFGWFSYLDGDEQVPTTRWRRRGDFGITAAKSLLLQMREMYLGQYGIDRWKLSGSQVCLGVMPFIGLPVYEVRTGRIYTTTSVSIMSKGTDATIEMIESLLGAPIVDESTPDPDPEVEPPPSTVDFDDDDFDTDDFYTA